MDFIFGSSLAVFDACEIRSLARRSKGWIAAPSTYPSQKIGFVFLDCTLTSEPAPGANAAGSYLGRPWRHTGRAVFIRCSMGGHILPEGWADWSKPEARAYQGFGEFGSMGPGAPGAATRVPWARILSEDEAAALSTLVTAFSDSVENLF